MTWTRIREEVDALVQFRSNQGQPILKSIEYGGKTRRFLGTPDITADERSVYYDARDRSSRYAVRFDREQLRWVLEGVDESRMMQPRDLPRWRYFPIPD